MQIFLKQPCQPNYITHPSCPSTTYFGLAQTRLTEAFLNYKIGIESPTVLIDFWDQIYTSFLFVCLFINPLSFRCRPHHGLFFFSKNLVFKKDYWGLLGYFFVFILKVPCVLLKIGTFLRLLIFLKDKAVTFCLIIKHN